MIPLGLYRTIEVNLRAYNEQARRFEGGGQDGGDNGQDRDKKDDVKKIINYVVTNPEQDTRIEERDLIYVLATSDPGDPEAWDEYD